MYACQGSSQGSGSTASSKRSTVQHVPLKVVVRVRPLLGNEARAWNTIRVLSDQTLMLGPKVENAAADAWGHDFAGDRARGNKDLIFGFDRVFGPDCNNRDIYGASIQETISKLIDGFNCSIFAYGPTGSGKTHTMLGNPDEKGLIFLLLNDIYTRIENEKNISFVINVSYLEVYNENVRDLLSPSSNCLKLQEDGSEIFVQGLRWFCPSSLEQVMLMLQNGNSQRTQHPTDANAESSRSHAVFQVRMKLTRKDENGTLVSKNVVRLNMIDLAGSERAAANNNNAQRLHEGANINKSLLALGNCIQALANGRSHVPYRDSKLTRLLKGALGGNSYTVMIGNVSPSNRAYEETCNTLRYASRAKDIKNCIRKVVEKPECVVAGLNLALDQAHRKIATLTAEKEELLNKILAAETTQKDDPLEKMETLLTIMKGILSARQAEAIATDLAATLECHLEEMSARYDEKIEKIQRLKSFALCGDISVEKIQEQRAVKCASMKAQLRAAKLELKKANDAALAAELDLEQWLVENEEPWADLIGVFKQLQEYKSLSNFVVCRVQKNHCKNSLEKKVTEKNELHQMVCLIAEQYSKIFNQRRCNVTEEMMSNYRKIQDLIKNNHQDASEGLPLQSPTEQHQPQPFNFRDTPSYRVHPHNQRAATYRPHMPAPFTLKDTPPRSKTTYSNCTPPAAGSE
ncbi:kinesin-like protein KIF18B isoform X2 [Cloeon dipterum]